MTANDKSQNDELVECGPLEGRLLESSLLESSLPADCAAALVYTTFPNRDAAVDAGRRLVEGRQAGCINILPGMTAVYVWNGVTEVADEVVLIAKVPVEGVARACTALRTLHPYDTPAILVLPLSAVNADYLAWLRAGTSAG